MVTRQDVNSPVSPCMCHLQGRWSHTCRFGTLADPPLVYGHALRTPSLWLPVNCYESRNWSPSSGLLVLQRRLVAGLDVESSVESCVNDVGKVLAGELEEPVVNSGTTIGTLFSALHWVILPFFKRCGFWPMVHPKEHLWSSQSLPSDRTAGVSLRIVLSRLNQDRRRTLLLPRLMALLRWL